MTTILRIKGAYFNDPSLPVVAPFVRAGLVGAFRPYSSDANMVDLSGAGATLSKIGSPTYSSVGMIGDGTNGFITNITEGLSSTIMVVARVLLGDVAAYTSTFFAGNYVLAGGQTYGHSLFSSGDPGSVSGQRTSLRGQTAYQNTITSVNDNLYMSSHLVADNTPIGAGTNNTTAWTFMAVTVDSIANKVTHYIPALSPKTEYNITSMSGSLASRARTAPPGRPMFIVAEGSAFGGTRAEIAEVLFYNRALSETEILQQYAVTQAFMSANRSIFV